MSAIAALYPSMRLAEICRLCRGNPTKVCDRYRCVLCKRTSKEYKEAGLEREVEEFNYLKQTWLKVKMYKQITTGIRKLDLAIQLLFGIPHTDGWRDYKRVKAKEDKFICLRMVGDH